MHVVNIYILFDRSMYRSIHIYIYTYIYIHRLYVYIYVYIKYIVICIGIIH